MKYELTITARQVNSWSKSWLEFYKYAKAQYAKIHINVKLRCSIITIECLNVEL